MSEISETEEIPKYKIILIGDEFTGKSSIFTRFVDDIFEPDYQETIGLDFKEKYVKINNQETCLLLYDTGGREKFRTLIPMYSRDANIIIFVYDITKKESFTHIPEWISYLTNQNKLDEVIFCLVGNKIDLEEQRQVTKEEGEKYAKDNNIIFQEVSAKTGDNISDLFYKKIIQQIIIKFKLGNQTDVQEVETENGKEKEKEKKFHDEINLLLNPENKLLKLNKELKDLNEEKKTIEEIIFYKELDKNIIYQIILKNNDNNL